MKINVTFCIVFLYAISIAFYLAKVSEFSPLYLCYIALLIPSAYVCIKSKLLNFTFDIKCALAILTYICTFHFTSIETGEFINLFLGLVGYIFIRMVSYKISNEQLIYIFKWMLRVSIILLVLDSIYRITNPTHPNKEVINTLMEGNSWFYLYKFNSLMFADSNTTALIVVILLFGILSLHNLDIKKFKEEIIFLILILLSCFSRSAVISVLITYCFYFYKTSLRKILYIFSASFIALVFMINFVIEYFLDGSFQSKFLIIDLLLNKLTDLSFYEILFGIGIGNSEEFLGIFPHIFLFTWFLETGVLGVILIASFLYLFSKKIDYLIPVAAMIMGLSYFLYLGTPFLFVPMALVASIKMNARKT